MQKYYLLFPSYSFKETGVRDDSQIILEQVSKSDLDNELRNLLNMYGNGLFEKLDELNVVKFRAKMHKMAKINNIANYRPVLLNCHFALDHVAENALLSLVIPDFRLITLEFINAPNLNYKLFTMPLQNPELIVNFKNTLFIKKQTGEKTEIKDMQVFKDFINSGAKFECSILSIKKQYMNYDMFNLMFFPYLIVSEKFINTFIRLNITGFNYNETPIIVDFD